MPEFPQESILEQYATAASDAKMLMFLLSHLEQENSVTLELQQVYLRSIARAEYEATILKEQYEQQGKR